MSAKAILSASVSAPPVYVEDVFSTFLYTGTGGTQTITNGIDLSGKGGLAWIKKRGPDANYGNHSLFDTNRGVKKVLSSDQGGPEGTYATQGVTVFSSSGFQVSDPGNYGVNESSATYASWTFRKAAKFFDVVTYTGTGSNTTIAHNLGSVPGSIIVRRRDTSADWAVYHRSLANTQYLVLNTTATAATGATWWNSTTPTSSVFSVGTDASVNASGGTYVAYLFAHDAGGFGTAGTDNVVKCGSITGTGAVQDINLGWEPQFVLLKITSTTGDWILIDNMRGFAANGDCNRLFPNLSLAEGPSTQIAPTATGFQYVATNGINASGATGIYIAIRRGPMKTPTVGTQVFYNTTGSTDSTSTFYTSGFPVDFGWEKTTTDTWDHFSFSRLQGPGKTLKFNSTGAETTSGAGPVLTSNTQFTGTGDIGTNNHVFYAFRRAPGFFDVVAYTWSGAPTVYSHNLGVNPELVILKTRSASGNWLVYSLTLGFNDRVQLNTTDAVINGGGFVTAVSPSTLSMSLPFGGGTTFIAYLFATLAGVSKVFNFTGTGTTLQINCGFTSGARLVLIKRTDSTGDWYIWDSARGIISGNDSYLLLNSTAAEVTNTDYIDPYSAGFEISSTAPAAINANGGSYIGLAIA